MESMSETKKSRKQSLDNRTTKTKASASKPEVFGISLTRNKNNQNPALFNSVKKKKVHLLGETPQSYQYQSQTKKNVSVKTQPSLFQDLNTRVSVDYINSLHSNLLIQLGHQLESHLENKENQISARNLAISLPSKQEKQCFNHMKDLIELKDRANKGYQCMKNTQDLFDYLTTQSDLQDFKVSLRNTHKIEDIHKAISDFLTSFRHQCIYLSKLEKQLEILEQKYKKFTQNVMEPQEEVKTEEELDEKNLDSMIQSLKQEIGNEKKLCLRYEKEEKFLMSKLYFTQKKNNDLKASSTNLQMQFLCYSQQKHEFKRHDKIKTCKPIKEKVKSVTKNSKELGNLAKDSHVTDVNKMTRSKSVSNLQGLSKSPYLPSIKKENLMH